MCGRFSIIKKAEDIVQRFSIKSGIEEYRPSYNSAPGQKLGVITNFEPGKLNMFLWGLIPFWAKDISIGNKMINARVETIGEKPSFRNLLNSKRCLVVADGFYEWEKDSGKKQPYRILLKDESLFAFAGLWDGWKDMEGSIIHTFTIITTTANEMMKKLHERMPVILEKENEKKWLAADTSMDIVKGILKPYPSEMMTYYPVSFLVNSPSNNRPEVVQRIE